MGKPVRIALGTLSILLTIWLPFAGALSKSLRVNKMTCESCAESIQKTFSQRPEVKTVKVDFKGSKMDIDFHKGRSLTDSEITQILSDLGFEAHF